MQKSSIRSCWLSKYSFLTVGEYSGSTFHMSSAAEKEDKDAIENCGVWVCTTKDFELRV